MKIFYTLVSVSLVGGSAVALILAVFSFIKKNQLFMLILSGAMLCFCLGELYWITYLSVEGVTPSGFHVPDLSFIGYYLFLITGEFGIVNERILKETGKSTVRFAALAAPVMMSGVSVFLILLGGRAFATIAYLIPSAVLAYFSLRNLLSVKYSPTAARIKGYSACNLLFVVLVETSYVFGAFSNPVGNGIAMIAAGFVIVAQAVTAMREVRV